MSDRKSGVSTVPARLFVVETEAFTSVRVEVCVAGNLWLPINPKSYSIEGKTVLGLQCAGKSLKDLVWSVSGFELVGGTVEVQPSTPAVRSDSVDAETAVDSTLTSALAEV